MLTVLKSAVLPVWYLPVIRVELGDMTVQVIATGINPLIKLINLQQCLILKPIQEPTRVVQNAGHRIVLTTCIGFHDA